MLIYIIIIIIITTSINAQVILIDPGHGGEECGAFIIQKKIKTCEKDIALSIARTLHSLLKDQHPTFLTRSIDRTLSLEERALMAEKIQATLFISIHVNSHSSKKPQGFETFYLDNHKNAAVKKLEMIENKDLKGEKVIVNQILADLVIQRTAPRSKKLARLVHNNLSNSLTKDYKMLDRGYKPALFYVLALTKRPAILLEVGFISNTHDQTLLKNKKFQDDYAKKVYKGILSFIKSEQKSNSLL